MKTSVVNVKVAHIRPEYNDLKEWMNDENNVYIGRKGIVFINNERFPKEDSIWHNPFKIDTDTTREDVLKKYVKYIKEKLDGDPLLVNKLLELKGKKLGCWCHPKLCHGDILVKMIKHYNKSKE